MGNCLQFRCITTHKRSSGRIVQTRVYKALKDDCTGCPIRDRCIPAKHTSRRVERMNCSEVLDRMAHRMSRKEIKELFKRRKVIAESPFGHIKHAMGIRRFLHRGLEKVRTEWTWICSAYNLNKLVRILLKARQSGSYQQMKCAFE
jgi:hypothetical protein